MLLNKSDLIELLEGMISEIKANDSFEGLIKYSFIADGVPRDKVEVVGFWRTGNSMGQGGCVAIPVTSGISIP